MRGFVIGFGFSLGLFGVGHINFQESGFGDGVSVLVLGFNFGLFGFCVGHINSQESRFGDGVRGFVIGFGFSFGLFGLGHTLSVGAGFVGEFFMGRLSLRMEFVSFEGSHVLGDSVHIGGGVGII